VGTARPWDTDPMTTDRELLQKAGELVVD